MKVGPSLLICGVFWFFLQCRQTEEHAVLKQNLDKEINNRMSLLSASSTGNDSLSIQITRWNEELFKIILLSKDLENLSASVYRSNRFFSQIAADFNLGPEGFGRFRSEMGPEEIELMLKRNHLFLLNHLVLTHGGGKILLFSAADETLH